MGAARLASWTRSAEKGALMDAAIAATEAAVAGLVRSDPRGPGITREKTADGFQYRDPSGALLTDPVALRRVRALVLPPAWRDVWISPDPLGHIQATGVDGRGRTQYRYHDRWRANRDEQKFAHMLRFAVALPGLRDATLRDLGQRRLGRDRVAAAAVRLIDLGLFRIGGERYAELDHHYGVTTLEKRHVTVGREGARFDYIAKEGKRREITVTDPAVQPTLRALTRAGHDLDHLFAWENGGTWHPLHSHDVSHYIADRAGAHFTAKEFRTWNATVLMALLLSGAEPAPAGRGRQRVITASVKGVAGWLGDTPTVARSSYIDPQLITRYESDGALPAIPPGPAELPAAAEAEAAVHALLAEPLSGPHPEPEGGLPGRPDAAVDGDDGAGDVSAGPPAQVDRDPGHVLGPADPAQRGGGRDVVAELGQGGRHHLRLERARRHRVDRDVPRSQLPRQHPGELVQPGLGRRVRIDRQGRHLEAVDAADVDHPGRVVGRACRLQQRQERPDQEERCLQVQVDQLVPGRFGILGQRGAPGRAGVVDQDVHPRLGLADDLGQPQALLLRGQIGGHRDHPPERGQLVDGGLPGLRLA
jgi:DNA topoisomerase I